MAGFRQNALNSYAQVGFESEINSANPHHLITLLFDGIVSTIAQAKLHMHSNQIEQKNLAISKATLLIDSGLRAGLNFEQGGDLASTLDDLYRYMLNRLMTAHLTNQIELLDEVLALILDLKQAWISISPEAKHDTQSIMQTESLTAST